LSATGTPLYDPSKSDLFGVSNDTYHEALEAFSEALSEALFWKSREASLNLLLAHGDTMNHAAVFTDCMRLAMRFAVAFSVVNGFVTFTDAGKATLGTAIPEPEAEATVLRLFNTGGDQ